MRLFIDVFSEKSHCYDFHGRDYGSAEDAAQMAELIAADLGSSETVDWIGLQVQVSDVAGEALFSVPVLAAA